MSLADLDQLSTDSDDEEYVPEGANLSSENSSGSEGDHEAEPTAGHPTTRQTSSRICPSTQRMRKKRQSSESKGKDKEDLEDKEVKEKARIDELWASFKKDTAPTTKGKGPLDVEPAPAKRLKIEKTYDFAGEKITVQKEVSTDSKEAKEYLKSTQPHAQSASAGEEASSMQTTAPSLEEGSRFQPKAATVQGRVPARAKRGSGLSAVLKSLGKKPKMSTLEKSSMDWDNYKHTNELEEELARNTKDGYLAKKEFLQWSDQKQFERERNERLKRFKKIN